MAKVVIFVTNNGDVLVGCGGQYRMDTVGRNRIAADRLAEDQRFRGPDDPATRQAAIAAFTARRKSNLFTIPKWKNDGAKSRWTTRFVEPECNPARRGFIKGDMETDDNGDPKNTAIREMLEETGFNMNPQNLVDLGNNTFHYPADNRERVEIMNSWAALDTRELVEIDWYRILDIRTKHLNPESRDRLESLPGIPPMPGGGKKTRRRRRRTGKKQKTRTVRAGK